MCDLVPKSTGYLWAWGFCRISSADAGGRGREPDMKEKGIAILESHGVLGITAFGKRRGYRYDDDAAASAQGFWAAFCVAAIHLVDEPKKERGNHNRAKVKISRPPDANIHFVGRPR